MKRGAVRQEREREIEEIMRGIHRALDARAMRSECSDESEHLRARMSVKT